MSLIQDFIVNRTPPDLYEEYLANDMFMPWADALIEATRPGGNCLDIACGTGVVSRKLSNLPQVKTVSAIDVAPPMIAKAQALQRENGLAPKAEFQIASASALPFKDSSFDTVLCQQGLQFFPDKLLALKEAARVLKPSGTFGAAVWTLAQDGNPVFGAFEDILARHFGTDVIPLGPFSWGDPDEIKAIARIAGLAVQAVERRELVIQLPTVSDLVLFDVMFLGKPAEDGTLQPVIDPEDPAADEQVGAIIAELTDAVGGLVQANGKLEALTTAHFLLAQRI